MKRAVVGHVVAGVTSRIRRLKPPANVRTRRLREAQGNIREAFAIGKVTVVACSGVSIVVAIVIECAIVSTKSIATLVVNV